jgi:OOP family OmpA-OmpF porin
MRKFVAPVLCTLMMIGAAAAMTGCTVHSSGGATPEQPPPPPPEPEAKKEEPPPEEPKQEFKMEGNKLLLPGAIVYKTGSAELDPVSEPVLATVKQYLDAKPKVTLLRIEGHTDDVGDDRSNLDLSAKRSQTVAKWLVGKGIDCKRLLPVGFGETKPIADNKTPDGKAQNRRTDFINAAREGKAIGGMPLDAGAPKVLDACTP